jgi:hypothetical membrane protein
MSQLVRPDLARARTAPDEGEPGSAQLAVENRPIPGWTVAAAALAPALLVGGWLIAGALQPASYSPMQQTMSDLAGQAATDPWVMTVALLGVGGCQLATGIGLTRVQMPARLLLILAGLSTVGVAASPEAATGATPRHLLFAVSCVVATLVWPVFVMQRDPARPVVLNIYGSLLVTAVFAALSGWLLITTQGGGDLGLAERLTSLAQGLWPLVVVLALRQADISSRGLRVPGWRTRAVRARPRRPR